MHARACILAAEYHYHRIRALLGQPEWPAALEKDAAPDAKRRAQQLQNETLFELRAFLWELVAGFDTAWTWVKRGDRETRDQSKPAADEDAGCAATPRHKRAEWDRRRQLLRSASRSEWFFELDRYRNHAHQAFFGMYMEFDGHFGRSQPTLERQWLLPAREGQRIGADLPKDLLSYVGHMRELLDAVLAEPPGAHG